VTHDLKTLIGKLGEVARRALEGAAGLCLSRTHHEVDIEHWLAKLLERHDTDLDRIVEHFGLDRARLEQQLSEALDALEGGNSRTPGLAPRIRRLIERAWLIASLDRHATIRSGHLVLALAEERELARLIGEGVTELALLAPERLRSRFLAITEGSSEGATATAEGAPRTTQALDRYTVDLADRAARGLIDPVLGREEEVRQIVDILMRRRQNNPILTGEAGVGKTAVVEGLALRIHAGDVPGPLREVVLRTLDLGLLQAGASVRGEFESRLKSVIDEVRASPRPIVLFIDEAHTLIGAGAGQGQGDAANLLKPALARGELRTIAATTWSEYKKYFEKDAALARRFQVVRIDEPDEARAVVMLRGLAPAMERHHGVRLLDEAVTEAVRLSARYLTGRQLPDKAVSVLDTACARVAVSQAAVPPPIEDSRRRIEALEAEVRALAREATTAETPSERQDAAARELETERAALAGLERRYEAESGLARRVRELRARLERAEAHLKGEFASVAGELRALQGESPLVHVAVDSQAVAEVISSWTGIPAGRMLKDEIARVRELEARLADRVIGQERALAAIAERIRTARARLDDPAKPIGVFLLVGPSGVGKTETALALAELLYGGERNLVAINMSEFQEAHSVATLKGSPPGYVGYGEGGVLTEAVRRRPYSVVLLDEIEKAHPDVLELFFQVFDKGTLDDAEGRSIDFRNTVLILTSNVGTEVIMRHADEPETIADALRPALRATFKPAFLGRLLVVPYRPLDDDVLEAIVAQKLGRIRARMRAGHDAELAWAPGLVRAIARRCTEVDSGARNVDAILGGSVLPAIAAHTLDRMAEGAALGDLRLELDPAGTITCVSL
jgi:type VI secretion system protein VasG